MRGILKKLHQGHELETAEYEQLLDYADKLRLASPESYSLFYEQYASLLYQRCGIVIPRFEQGFDDLLNYLSFHPEALPCLQLNPLPLQEFPSGLHPYLDYTFSRPTDRAALQRLLDVLAQEVPATCLLPRARTVPPVYKYEDGNIGKEIGLMAHFDRLGRYAFVTRLQTYRYLARKKAKLDRFEYIDSDRLGAIFTNKDKSIYYLVFLSEADPAKTKNACRLLNIAFYGR